MPRLSSFIEFVNHLADSVESRIKLLKVAARPIPEKNFVAVTATLLGVHRLRIKYYSRIRGNESERFTPVSHSLPRQLVWLKGWALEVMI
jgi:hypothetical protein